MDELTEPERLEQELREYFEAFGSVKNLKLV